MGLIPLQVLRILHAAPDIRSILHLNPAAE